MLYPGELTLAAIIANGLHWYKVKNISPMPLGWYHKTRGGITKRVFASYEGRIVASGRRGLEIPVNRFDR